jgi:acetyl-CoA synthetase
VPDDVKGTAVWCFCVIAPGTEPSSGLALEIKNTVSDELGKAFTASEVRFVDELPKTRSAKILRRAIRARVLGEDAGDLSSLENESALDALDKALR